MTQKLDLKLNNLVDLYAGVCERTPKVGREAIVLPWLNDIYTITTSFFKICESEALRLGILKR